MFKVNISRAPLGIEVEVGSIKEAIGVIEENAADLAKLFEIPFVPGQPAAAPEAAEPAKRGRKPKNQPDPATASAPPPAPVPAAAPAPDLPIPAFLDHTGAAAPPPTPPPPAPPAPPTPPTPPPTPPVAAGVLAPKVIAELDKRASASADKGQALADWLCQSGITIKGATYAEAVEVVRVTSDAKLAPIAAALGC